MINQANAIRRVFVFVGIAVETTTRTFGHLLAPVIADLGCNIDITHDV